MKRIINKIQLFCFSFFTWVMTFLIMIQTPALADTEEWHVDPAAPLDILKDARKAAAHSNIDFDHVQKATNNLSSIIMMVCVVIGVVLAGSSIYKLYKNVDGGDNTLESNIQYIVGIVLGVALIIFGIIIGIF